MLDTIIDWIVGFYLANSHWVNGYAVVGVLQWFAEFKSNGGFKAIAGAFKDPEVNNVMLVWNALPVFAISLVLGIALWLPAAMVGALSQIIEGGWGPDEDEETETP